LLPLTISFFLLLHSFIHSFPFIALILNMIPKSEQSGGKMKIIKDQTNYVLSQAF